MSTKLPTVAIVGQTNVGKSSLFNRLVGQQQAIVAYEPGTTRDRVVGKVTVGRRVIKDGRESKPSTHARHPDQTSEFWLVDTAGLKSAEDEFEASIQEQIDEASDIADVIVVVVDGTKPIDHLDRTAAKQAHKSKKPVILAINKSDLKGSLPQNEFKGLGIKDSLATSTEHNAGISKLLEAITSHLPSTNYQLPSDSALRIALIGRPNAGKSYLFNTLAGKQQAIVSATSQTTRDTNRVSLRFAQKQLELLDTAGVRKQGKIAVGIEKFSVLRTLQAIQESDICFLVMDVNETNTQLDQRLAGLISDAGKGMVIVVSKWDDVEGKDAYTRDALAPQIAKTFDFVPWAPLIFTSAKTGQNVAKLFDLAFEIATRRQQQLKTVQLNKMLQEAVRKHPPAGLKNTHPKLRYIVQTDTNPPWFVVHGSNLKLLHWSYKRYLEKTLRANFDYIGTSIKFSFRQADKDK